MANPINPARVDFVTLRLFCAVAQSGSITKGAEACHLALSAASRRLSDFEAATGSKLLERSSQGIALTPAGHVAMQHAMRLFQGFEYTGLDKVFDVYDTEEAALAAFAAGATGKTSSG